MKRLFLSLTFTLKLTLTFALTLAFTFTLTLPLYAPPALAQSTINNTSSCSGNGTPTAGCNAAFPGFNTNPSNTGAQTPIPDPIPTNISTVNVHTLLYPGSTTRIGAHYQPWFCNTSYPSNCNGHKNIGMNENSGAQVASQLSWMHAVGMDYVVIDWYGSLNHSFELTTTGLVSSTIAGAPASYPKLMIQIDQGAINGAGQCPFAGGDQSACLIAAINTQMDYAAAHYLYQTYYESDAATGDPIVPFFIDQTNWPGTNFATVYSAVHSHVQSGNSCGAGCTYTKSVLLLDRNSGGFTETGMDGAFAWPNPPPWSATNQFCWQQSDCSFNYLNNFYTVARSHSSKIAMGVVYKGFDDFNASFDPTNQVIAQQCGQVVNLTANVIPAQGYSSSSQLQYIQIPWNDYEEGTETETGINNCITITTPSIIAGTISWSLAKSDATYGTTSTINSFSIYTGISSPTTLYASGISPTATSHAAPPTPGGLKAFIYMVGGPLIQNRLSAGVLGPPSTYYVASIGSDSNDGMTKTTPWLHHPKMSTFTGTYSPVAGDQIIMRGGDTWHAASGSPLIGTWTINNSGSAGNINYTGVDPTWFNAATCGASWCRPVINGDNPLWAGGSSFPAACAHANTTPVSINASFVKFDNFEIVGFCWTGQASSNGAHIAVTGGNTNVSLTNHFIHGWSMPAGASDNFPAITTFGGGTVADNTVIASNVIDGVDSPHFAAATPIGGSGNLPACQWSADNNAGITNITENSSSVVTLRVNLVGGAGTGSTFVNANGGPITFQALTTATWLNNVNTTLTSASCVGGNCTTATQDDLVFTDPTAHGVFASHAETGVAGMTGCASGQGINGSHAADIHGNVFRYLSNDIVTANLTTMHDNLSEYLYNTFASGSLQQHPNVVNDLGCPTGGALSVYNNVIRHTFVSEDLFLATCTTAYFFNNVMYDNMNSVFGPLASACVRWNTASNSTLPVTAYIYNNSDGDNSCQAKFEVANSPLTQWSGTANFENDYFGAQGSNCTGTCGTPLASEYTCVTGGTCTITNNGTHVFQTTATQTAQGYTAANMYQPTLGGSTIGAGTNNAGLVPIFSPDSAYGSGSGAGASEQTGSGGKIAVSPAIPLIMRPSGWDAGAFQFPFVLTVTIVGQGSVVSSPAGINASGPGSYTASFGSGTVVTLSETPGAGYVLQNWSTCAIGPTCNVTVSGTTATVAVFSNNTVILPQLWVDNNEATDGSVYVPPVYEMSFPTVGWLGIAPPTCTFHLPYANTSTGLQSAVTDVETCRTGTGAGSILDVPAGTVYSNSTSNGLLIPQTNTVAATQFNIIRSTQDALLPDGQTVCSHGIQDNLITSSDIGLDNPDCAGDAMYFQLGTTITNIAPGAFALANGIFTNTANYNDVANMWTLETTGVNASALTFCNASGTAVAPTCSTNIGPDHWLIEDAEIRKAPGVTSSSNVISVTGGGVGVATALSQYATHIHFRKVWEHGDWTTLLAGTNQITTGMQMSCTYCSLVDSQFSENLRPGAEGHTISPNGPGPYKFSHNWLEGSSSCIFAGGNEGVVQFGIPTLVTFQDVEMRRNRCTFPYSWLGVLRVPAGNATWPNQAITRKNMEEIKNGDRVLMDGNIFENSDNSGGQSGVEFDINLKNWLVNYELSMTDITFTNNIIRNSCEGFEQEGTGNSSGNGTGNAYAQNRTIYANNLFYNVSALNPGCTGVNGTNDTITAPAFQWQGTVTMNSNGTATFTGNCSAASVANGGTASTCPGSLQSVTVNTGGSCSVNGSLTIGAPAQGGRQATGTYACSGGAVTSTTVTNQGSLYLSAPTVTAGATGATLTAVLITSASNPPQGAEVMDILPGDSIAIFGCQTIPAFNQTLRNLGSGSGYWPTGVGPTVTTGSTPFSGSFSVPNITVSYAWSGVTPGTVDNSGYCTLSELSGSPENYTFTHNTVISDSKQFFTSGAAKSLPPYAKNTLFNNSIFIAGSGAGTNGWFMSVAPSPQEGTNTEAYNHDINTLTVDHNVIPGRTGSLYTAYGNNPSFPAASPALFFPATSSAIGFACSGCSSVVSLALSDYHGYALTLTSPYHNAASDGTDIGATISTIDGSQIKNLYVCLTSCGTGPYPDTISVSDTLTVNVNGSGTVTDNHSEISCPIACTAGYPPSTVVNLTPTPGIGYVFAAWSGACSGSGACSITMSGNTAVTATFSAIVPSPGNVINGTIITTGSAVK